MGIFFAPEYHHCGLEYTLANDGLLYFHSPEAGEFTALSELDMEPFNATHPNATGLLDGSVVPDSDDGYFSGFRYVNSDGKCGQNFNAKDNDELSVCSYRSTPSIVDTEWGNVSYIDDDGYMDTYQNAEPREGPHRRLHRCTWVPLPRRKTTGAAAKAPELVLTTPDGNEHSLEDFGYYPCANAWANSNDEE
jgi:hypothetical protein